MKAKMLLATCLVLTVSAKSQLRFRNVQELWAYADTQNVQLQAMAVSEKQQQIMVRESVGELLPVVSANGAFTDNMTIQPTLIPAGLFDPTASPDTYTEAVFGRRYVYNANLSVQVSVLDIQKWMSIKTARLGKELASLKSAQSRLELYTQLANSWYTYLLLKEAERLWQHNVESTLASAEMASNLLSEGQVSEVVVNLASINLLKAKQNLELARANKVLQLNSLATLLNTIDSIQVDETLEADGRIVSADPFTPDPAISLAKAEMLLAKHKWKTTQAAYVPVLSAVYQANTQIVGDQFLKFSHSNSLPQQYWGLRLAIPIFSGNSRRYQVEKARLAFEQSIKDDTRVRIESVLRDSSISVEYHRSQLAFNRSQSILQLYQSNDAHAALKLQEGLISLDERLKIYNDLINSQSEYFNNLSDYLIQQYRMRIRQTNFLK